MGRWWAYELEPDEDDYEDFVGDEGWEDGVPEDWWANDAADAQYAAAEPARNQP